MANNSKKNDKKIFIFAGGGTGGHLYPGLAVAEKLVELDPAALPVFACSDRPIDEKILSQTPFCFFAQPVKPISKSPQKWPAMIDGWRRSISLGKTVLADLKPSAVVGLGGFAAGAMCKAASQKNIPTAMLNPDAIPGKANKYLAGIVDKIFTQFEKTADFFKPACRDKIQIVGCPVRSEITSGNRREALEFFGLDGDKMTLLVFGGSALAESIILAVQQLADELGKLGDTWQIIMPASKKLAPQIKKTFADKPIKIVMPEYCSRMDMAYAAADLALCRGGAGTIAELSATATPAVIMPYPYHADKQQYLNSAGLQKQGSAMIIDDLIDPTTNAGFLRETLIAVMQNDNTLQTMTAAARQNAKTDAADTIAKWLLKN